ncbi:MAG: helix-turn-helix domain-containing protein [Candidatus Marinimicrobia bacterium]|nr:helix-turn-helix domain-containing protein [Candidatus Neomarinimicrobiota bacterium]
MDNGTDAKPKLLLVDEDKKVIEQLREVLEAQFDLQISANIEKAFSDVVQFKPVGIICEIIFSGNCDLGLIQRVRKNPDLAATPIIVLSALQARYNSIKAYNALADLYLRKPFNPEELLASLSGLIRIRELLRKSYPVESPGSPGVRSEEDGQLINRLDTIIHARLADPTLNVKDLAKACFTSERNLERKLHDLLGITPSEHLRKIRMNKAWSLLDSGQQTSICTVAKAVGYRNERSFQRAFNTVFGKNPSRLIRS